MRILCTRSKNSNSNYSPTPHYRSNSQLGQSICIKAWVSHGNFFDFFVFKKDYCRTKILGRGDSSYGIGIKRAIGRSQKLSSHIEIKPLTLAVQCVNVVSSR